MTPAAMLTALAEAGITATAEGDALVLRPASAVPPDLLAECRNMKAALIAALRSEAANENAIYIHILCHKTPPHPMESNTATAAAGPGLLPLSEIVALVAAIAAADPIAAPDVLRRAIRTMLDAGHGRGETLQTLLPAVPLGCNPGALAIAVWDGETPPAEAAP
jgi:hypothetical protein